MTSSTTSETLAISVCGPGGVLDLVVPAGARATDVAREYAGQAGLAGIPLLQTGTGALVPAHVALPDAGVEPGDLLVAATGVHRSRTTTGDARAVASGTGPADLAALLGCLAAGAALLAGWAIARTADDSLARVVAVVLGVTALSGVLPVGRRTTLRARVAPAFAAAAALVLVWHPDPERMPMVVGTVALAGALAAGVARALATEPDATLDVWIVAGAVLFVGAGVAAVLGAGAATVWAMALVLVMLAARLVPSYAVRVPDEALLDLRKLAVTAWSARELPSGRRGRMMIRTDAVEAIVARGTRIVAAASVAVAVVTVVGSVQLLATATLPVDRIGARCLVLFVGAALLLTARSHRHPVARVMLRLAGLSAWAVLVVVLAGELGVVASLVLAGAAAVLGGVVVVAAVATGRGWRSVWWSRKAEVAEGLAGAFAVASVCVASGLVRNLWEVVSVVFRT